MLGMASTGQRQVVVSMRKGRIGGSGRRMVVVPVEGIRIVPWWLIRGWSLQNQGGQW
jgi:hypothetical protein